MDVFESKRAAHAEKPLADLIPFSSLVADDVVLCRDGSLLASWILEGISFETAPIPDIEQAAENFNRFLISIAKNDLAIQVHRVRRHYHDALARRHERGFAADFANRYNEIMSGNALMSTEIYVTLVQGDRAKVKKGLFAKLFDPAPSTRLIQKELDERLKEFGKICEQLDKTLERYNSNRLGIYDGPEGRPMSEQLEFYNYLVTGEWVPVAVPQGPIYNALGNTQVFAGRDMLQLTTPRGSRFMQSVEIKDYPVQVSAGILDTLLYRTPGSHNYEFVESQTFALMNRADAMHALELQKRQLRASEDKAGNQIADLEAAQSALVNGFFAMGEYSYALLVFGDTEAECRKNTHDAAEKLTKAGFLPVVSTLMASCAWLSAWPTCIRWRTRVAKVTSSNFAALAPFHNFVPGKRNRNPWGEALALMRQPSDQPYYFNLHASPRFENSFGKPVAGNTVIFGTTGSGKTALVSFIATMAMKYKEPDRKFSLIFFDKDHGAEILVRALKGTYLSVENGQRTGFNPFSLPPTDENIQFLITFVHLLLKSDDRPISVVDEQKIDRAVKSVMMMDRPFRRLSTLVQNITEGSTTEERENSIPRRLAQWYGDGVYAWVFDNDTDVIDIDATDVFGIDGTDFLDNPMVKVPISYYLLYRVQQALDGRRLIFVMDEFWKWLGSEAFRQFAFDQLKTIRKKNALIILATQSPSDVLKNEIAKAVLEQTSTQIFLPNAQADEHEYRDEFKVSAVEYYFIKQMQVSSRTMLIKQNGASTMAILDLSAFKDELNVLSSTTENIDTMHAIVSQLYPRLGEKAKDPEVWLPIFYDAIRTRNKDNKKEH